MSDHVTELDRLIEQQDQELARDGTVSPLTQLQLACYADGQPVPHVGHSPEVELATARWLQTLSRSRMPSASCDDDDLWFDDEYAWETWHVSVRWQQ
ncbi:MAG TPA: hypothetical protein VEL31_24060 [Ktedonobacteraceae bacterium]|nr:hypothetical protein [Ktedonobacteraceae bacterium]